MVDSDTQLADRQENTLKNLYFKANILLKHTSSWQLDSRKLIRTWEEIWSIEEDNLWHQKFTEFTRPSLQMDILRKASINDKQKTGPFQGQQFNHLDKTYFM